MNAKELIQRTEANLLTQAHTTLQAATSVQLHNALSAAAMEQIAPLWQAKEAERYPRRQAYYLSMEYLVGRLVYNNLYCMGLLTEVKKLLSEKGVDLATLEDIEDDAFGNGGLGRLAACFLDSAVTCNLPLTGYGLRFKYGLFKQSFVDGRQMESPDDWSRFGDPWSIRRIEEAVVVSMKTGDVLAVPYDMPVVGYGLKNVGTLRLWQTESLHEIDFSLFNDQQYARAAADKNQAEDIVKILYPNDSKRAGKQLRVKQQYVLVSASLQDLLRKYEQRHGQDYSTFPQEVTAQLNDTHPVMAIPELIRLLGLRGVDFENAFVLAQQTFAYTNHTVMQEALEKWDLPLLSSVCPEIVAIMRQIDARFKAEMKQLGKEVLPDRCIIEGRRVHMAQLAVYATHATNGVAELHSQILKDDLFSKWFEIYPDRFQNKTNGITQRRWLGLCNPELCALIESRVGAGFETDLDRLQGLIPLLDDTLCQEFMAVKRAKKAQLAAEIEKRESISLSPDMVFDVQVKRLHEYKRQFMNALSILAIYQSLKQGELQDLPPVAFIFGAKAAPGYARAKAVIYWINQIAALVNNDPDVAGRLKVVFVQNYNCSWAEKIIPAADISEQISPAGTEASGTGNMKLMLNGAVTLGTFDGANVEITEEAGRENEYIFGATVAELNTLKEGYDPQAIYDANPAIRAALDTLDDGTFPEIPGFAPGQEGALAELKQAILKGASWHAPDHYFVLQDFPSYLEAKLAAISDAGHHPLVFARKCLMNVATAGKFSSDRTIRQYAQEIWQVEEITD
ncbi:MAG: glycogen/starch/alpha-glucan family phosphorylase [Clostridia bacterium]|nr:glycogen/starch/alpha-glucan family phosphorylase [Clostridia bacterium]